MRKINKWLMVCVCALFSLTGCYNTEPRENVLKIYNWADYIDGSRKRKETVSESWKGNPDRPLYRQSERQRERKIIC